MHLRIDRNDILESSFSAWTDARRVDLRRKLKIDFLGEDTIDVNGVKREYITIFSQCIFSPSVMEESEESSISLFVSGEDGSVFPNPNARSNSGTFIMIFCYKVLY